MGKSLTHLGLDFLVVKLLPNWQGFVRLKQDHMCRAEYLAHSRPSINGS